MAYRASTGHGWNRLGYLLDVPNSAYYSLGSVIVQPERRMTTVKRLTGKPWICFLVVEGGCTLLDGGSHGQLSTRVARSSARWGRGQRSVTSVCTVHCTMQGSEGSRAEAGAGEIAREDEVAAALKRRAGDRDLGVSNILDGSSATMNRSDMICWGGRQETSFILGRLLMMLLLRRCENHKAGVSFQVW